jgi:hypothetical protein
MIDLPCARCSKLVRGHATETPEGWICDACANVSTTKRVWKVVIFAGCGLIALWVFLLLMFLAIWQFLSPEKPPGAARDAGAGAPEALTQRYEMGNGLLVVVYPPSFAASKQGDAVVTVARNLPGGGSQGLVFEVVPNPISNDLKENNRLIVAAEAKMLDGYVELSNGPGTCNGRPGIEVIATFQGNDRITYERRACRFQEGARLYSFAYSLPRTSAPAERALLERITGAVEIRP